MKRAGRAFSALLICVLMCIKISAESPSVYILSSGNSTYQAQTIATLQAALASQQLTPAIVVGTLSDINSPAIAPNQLLVTIGVEATNAAMTHHAGNPILGLMIPELSWRELLSRHPGAGQARGAVFIDQPATRLLNLGHLLKPDARRYGTVFGPVSKAQETGLLEAAEELGFSLHSSTLGADENPIAALSPVVEASDVFLAIPDRAAFNRSIAKWVLYLSYRNRIPVIGFSRTYTEAGALASVFSTPADIGEQAAKRVGAWLAGDVETIPGGEFPYYFQVLTNPTVARSLGLTLPPAQQLISDLERMETSAVVQGR